MPAAAATSLHVIRRPDQAAAMMDPVRLRLVRELAEPDSASGLSRRLGLPRQRINYHLRELESAGLLEQVAQRKKGNCVERLVQAVARTYVISPEALGELGEHRAAPDRFSSAYLAGAAARVLRDVGELRGRAQRAGKPLATLTLESEVAFASAADRAAFAEELTREVARLVAEYHSPATPGARAYRFTLTGYPAITKPEEPPGAVGATRTPPAELPPTPSTPTTPGDAA